MLKNQIVKPAIAQRSKTVFSFNIPQVDELFPGFTLGDFAVLYGSPSVISLTSLLCVRAQLPPQLGGLASKVIFIDGGNTFRLYKIARLAQLHQLNPNETLASIYISRAFTAYQLTSLIMEKLEETIQRYNAKVVVISDIAGFFLDQNVSAEEAQTVYSQIVSYLLEFAKKHQIILIATYLPYERSKRNNCLQDMIITSANTVLCFTTTKYTKKVTLEKHPLYMLGVAKLSSENRTLMDFIGADIG